MPAWKSGFSFELEQRRPEALWRLQTATDARPHSEICLAWIRGRWSDAAVNRGGLSCECTYFVSLIVPNGLICNESPQAHSGKNSRILTYLVSKTISK